MITTVCPKCHKPIGDTCCCGVKQKLIEKINKELLEILIEGFATSPTRCWHTEGKTKDEIETLRIENLNHIRNLIEEIKAKLMRS